MPRILRPSALVIDNNNPEKSNESNLRPEALLLHTSIDKDGFCLHLTQLQRSGNTGNHFATFECSKPTVAAHTDSRSCPLTKRRKEQPFATLSKHIACGTYNALSVLCHLCCFRGSTCHHFALPLHANTNIHTTDRLLRVHYHSARPRGNNHIKIQPAVVYNAPFLHIVVMPPRCTSKHRRQSSS